MKAVKPPVRSCTWRSRSRCSTRSATVSTWPNIMVAVVRMPRPCASSMTRSHSSVVALRGAIFSRTDSTRISAPPPGIESMPAACSRRSTSSVEVLETWDRCTISGGLMACRWSAGQRCLRSRNSSSNQAVSSLGWWPPCIRICTPPTSTVSCTLR